MLLLRIVQGNLPHKQGGGLSSYKNQKLAPGKPYGIKVTDLKAAFLHKCS
jgi:hypothetical protein